MIRGRDPASQQGLFVEIPDILRGRITAKAHLKCQVKVTVIQVSVPVDIDLMPAHQPFQRTGVEGFLQQIEVFPVLLGGPEVTPKSADRHVGDRIQSREPDPKTLRQFPPVIRLKPRLNGWKTGALGVENQMEQQVLGNAIAQAVQNFQGILLKYKLQG